jgi:hypothetical protein
MNLARDIVPETYKDFSSASGGQNDYSPGQHPGTNKDIISIFRPPLADRMNVARDNVPG